MGLLTLLALSACQSVETSPSRPNTFDPETKHQHTLKPRQAITALKRAIEAYPFVDGISLKATVVPDEWSGDLVDTYLSPVQFGQWKLYPYRIDENKVTFSLFYDFATKRIEGDQIPGVGKHRV